MDIDQIVAHEAMLMGRDVFYVDGWAYESDRETVQVVIFDAAPLPIDLDTVKDNWMHERRFAVYINGHASTGGNVRTWFSE